MVASEENDERMVAAEEAPSVRLSGLQREYENTSGHRTYAPRAILCNGATDDGDLFPDLIYGTSCDPVYGGSGAVPREMDPADRSLECVCPANGLAAV